jgi:hypothetical protein
VRDKLISEHQSSAELLKPFLRGRDVKRWCVEPNDLWMIYIPWHFPLHADLAISTASPKAEAEFRKRYPAVYAYLVRFREQLEARDQAEIGIRYEWYALARPREESWQEFEKPKIVFTDIAQRGEFGWDDGNHYVLNTAYSLPTTERWLLAVLNSHAVLWFYTRISNTIRGGFVRFIRQYVEQIPIPRTNPRQQASVQQQVDEIIAQKRAGEFFGEIEARLDGLVAHLYGLKEDEYWLILDELALPDPVRVGALNAYRETALILAKGSRKSTPN